MQIAKCKMTKHLRIKDLFCRGAIIFYRYYLNILIILTSSVLVFEGNTLEKGKADC